MLALRTRERRRVGQRCRGSAGSSGWAEWWASAVVAVPRTGRYPVSGATPSSGRCRTLRSAPVFITRPIFATRIRGRRPTATANACVAANTSAISGESPACAPNTPGNRLRSPRCAGRTPSPTHPRSLISGSIGIATVVDVEYVDNLFGLVDAVPDAVHAPPSPPLPNERRAKRAPYPVRVVGQLAEDELDACGAAGLGQFLRPVSYTHLRAHETD